MTRYEGLAAKNAEAAAAGLRRSLRALAMTGPVTAEVEDRSVTVFCSNDYLGLSGHPDVRRAYEGTGTGASRLISGDRPVHHAIEDRLSELYGRPATLFSSGYHANLGLYPAVLEEGDVAASDALNHASIIDGLRLSKATRSVMAHAHAQVPAGARLAVVEGVYSMDGDVLQLGKYAGDHWLVVDEAHAFGTVGPQGRGQAAAQGIEADFIVGTLSKAIGVYGGFVVGPPELREALVSRARSFVYTTGLPEPVANAALRALEIAAGPDGEARRERLASNARRLRAGLWQLGLDVRGSSQVVPVVLGEKTMGVAGALFERGFLATGIRAPTVPAGSERIRLTVCAEHTDEQIDRLLSALEAVAGSAATPRAPGGRMRPPKPDQ